MALLRVPDVRFTQPYSLLCIRRSSAMPLDILGHGSRNSRDQKNRYFSDLNIRVHFSGVRLLV